MKILHFIYDHPANPWIGGGGAHRIMKLSRLLAAKGHKIHVCCGNFPGAKPGGSEGVTEQFLGTGQRYISSTFSFARAARALAKETFQNYDVVVEDFAPWNPIFTYRLRKRPTVIQIQNYFGREILKKYLVAGLPFWMLERWYPRKFSHAIVINEALNARFKIRGKIISMGVDPILLEKTATGSDYAAFLGRLDWHQKGVDLLLDAAGETALPLRIAGDGPGRAQLQSRLAALPNVTWEGWVDGPKKTEFLAGCKFLLVPSRFEGQNMAVLEAAALGKSVLVSNINELQYAVQNGFGLTFESGSAQDLEVQWRKLWTDAALRYALESRARDYARDLTWPHLADIYENYLQTLIA